MHKLETPEMPVQAKTCSCDVDIKKVIDDTVNATVLKLKMAGLMKDDRKTAYQKTEELLRNYQTFKQVEDQPYTQKIVKLIEEALLEIKDDPYYQIITMIYFDQMTREQVADYFYTTVTTISRNKARLVNKLKIRLFSDDVIYELFL